ncbi:GntR family transcriptional regulator [Paenibacillus harenae]|uniref:GntR family transcriptional regulator of arabinose operon n=1 Tax=Paenibacillus harenae TaxID=306543 RepID=A0ABT9TTF7_PAEHA|nr:GntR family transcriptional regulator [Paenibacillus harenae]MDQ0110623.1 GntR family transcriptional regulator of arabinose operon [Paenibacillus harenae]
MNSSERIPLYQMVQEYLRDLISSQALKVGDRIPTEKELMERFGVSKITVVNALSGLVNERIITRVPGKGTFVSVSEYEIPTTSPKSAVKHINNTSEEMRTRMIGLIMPSIYDYFTIRLIQGIQQALNENDYRCVIYLSEGNIDKEKEAIKTCSKIGVEGLLIFPVDEELFNEEILSMKFAGFPFVLIDRYLPGVETHYIASDGRLGVNMAVNYLWELGHREIAICSDSPIQTVTVQERIDGYMNAFKEKGSLINPAHIVTGFEIGSLEQAETHPLYRYIQNRMATAYITLNGSLGVKIYQIARQAGLKVPEDISIISFDDPTSIIEGYSTFTHVKQFEHDMGYRAAYTLLEVINSDDGQQGKYFKTLVEPELVIGETTGKNVFSTS